MGVLRPHLILDGVFGIEYTIGLPPQKLVLVYFVPAAEDE